MRWKTAFSVPELRNPTVPLAWVASTVVSTSTPSTKVVKVSPTTSMRRVCGSAKPSSITSPMPTSLSSV